MKGRDARVLAAAYDRQQRHAVSFLQSCFKSFQLVKKISVHGDYVIRLNIRCLGLVDGFPEGFSIPFGENRKQIANGHVVACLYGFLSFLACNVLDVTEVFNLNLQEARTPCSLCHPRVLGSDIIVSPVASVEPA